jgi:protein-S-isoprenylcysteine O-methyltransferase Ste14
LRSYAGTAAGLCIVFGVLELVLSVTRRSTAAASRADRGSMAVLWLVIALSIVLAFYATNTARYAAFAVNRIVYIVALVLFGAGLALRWYAIIHLGRFFTVDVAIAEGHRVVDTGPYRFVRHPSYTGVLLAFAGLGLLTGNAISLALFIVPTFAAYLYRIRVEEAALRGGIGEPYIEYSARTARLIPGIY